MITKVYKLMGDEYEINESKEVYATQELAMIAAKSWEGFLGMSAEAALECDELRIVEWEFIS